MASVPLNSLHKHQSSAGPPGLQHICICLQCFVHIQYAAILMRNGRYLSLMWIFNSHSPLVNFTYLVHDSPTTVVSIANSCLVYHVFLPSLCYSIIHIYCLTSTSSTSFPFACSIHHHHFLSCISQWHHHHIFLGIPPVVARLSLANSFFIDSHQRYAFFISPASCVLTMGNHLPPLQRCKDAVVPSVLGSPMAPLAIGSQGAESSCE